MGGPHISRYLNTSESTAHKWEAGTKRPSGMAWPWSKSTGSKCRPELAAIVLIATRKRMLKQHLSVIEVDRGHRRCVTSE
jgi:hypothetical protein